MTDGRRRGVSARARRRRARPSGSCSGARTIRASPARSRVRALTMDRVSRCCERCRGSGGAHAARAGAGAEDGTYGRSREVRARVGVVRSGGSDSRALGAGCPAPPSSRCDACRVRRPGPWPSGSWRGIAYQTMPIWPSPMATLVARVAASNRVIVRSYGRSLPRLRGRGACRAAAIQIDAERRPACSRTRYPSRCCRGTSSRLAWPRANDVAASHARRQAPFRARGSRQWRGPKTRTAVPKTPARTAMSGTLAMRCTRPAPTAR